MVAVVAEAFVHTIQAQVDVFKTTQHSASQALSVCFVFAGGCVEVLAEVVHLGILPPVPFNAKETYLVRVEDLLLLQEEYLLLQEEEDFLLAQEEDLLLVQEEDLCSM